jgi:hypothetical protein
LTGDRGRLATMFSYGSHRNERILYILKWILAAAGVAMIFAFDGRYRLWVLAVGLPLGLLLDLLRKRARQKA